MSSTPPPSDSSQDESDTSTNRPVASDELLPPVEPPSARFIVQLFVLPAVIVLFVVLIWLLVTTLATRSEQNPQQIVEVLRSSSQNRWQKANELADMLRLEERYPELKQNTELASDLATLLEEQVEAAETDDNSVQLRYFLCRVLGEFKVDEGLGVLLQAAREDVELDVRREAINALAVLSKHLASEGKQIEHPELVETFAALANDQDDLIRSQTAFALGVIVEQEEADPRLKEELIKLVDDLYLDARFNAALGLARQGSLLAVPPLTEMLDEETLVISLKGETTDAAQTYKRNMVLHNALNAIENVREANPEEDLSELRSALERFIETAPNWETAGNVPPALIERAQEVLAGFRKE